MARTFEFVSQFVGCVTVTVSPSPDVRLLLLLIIRLFHDYYYYFGMLSCVDGIIVLPGNMNTRIKCRGLHEQAAINAPRLFHIRGPDWQIISVEPCFWIFLCFKSYHVETLNVLSCYASYIHNIWALQLSDHVAAWNHIIELMSIAFGSRECFQIISLILAVWSCASNHTIEQWALLLKTSRYASNHIIEPCCVDRLPYVSKSLYIWCEW